MLLWSQNCRTVLRREMYYRLCICVFVQAAKVTDVGVIASVSLRAGGPPELINAALAAAKGTDGRGGLPDGVEPFIIPIPSRFGERHDWPDELLAVSFAAPATVLSNPPWSSVLRTLRDAATAAVNLDRGAHRPASAETWDVCMGSLRKFLGFVHVMGWRRVGLALLWDGFLMMEYATFLMEGRDLEGATIARDVACLHRLAGLSVAYLPEAERPGAADYLVRPSWRYCLFS